MRERSRTPSHPRREEAGPVYFVERLTVRSWWFDIWPRLLRLTRQGRRDGVCYVIEGSRVALGIARVWARFAGVILEPLRFRLVDIREDGMLVRYKVAYEDLAEVRAAALQDPRFQRALVCGADRGRLPMYLSKALTLIDLTGWDTLLRAVLVLRVCRWKLAGQRGSSTPVVFLERRPWFNALRQYADRQGLEVIPTTPSLGSMRTILKRVLHPQLVQAVKTAGDRTAIVVRRGMSLWRRRGTALPRAASEGARRSRGQPLLAVEYYGHLNLSRPERYSDVFFWQQSSLLAQDVLVVFNVAADPLDTQKWDELGTHGISAVAVGRQGTTVPEAPVFLPRLTPPRPLDLGLVSSPPGAETSWLTRHLQMYETARAFWVDFFSSYGVKLYVSWMKFDALHCAIADALQERGGLFVSYQRSYESHPAAEAAASVDIMFGFSAVSADMERRAGSRIPYYVVTGYLGDHRFAALRVEAQHVRQHLHQRGVKHILAYSDENSHADERWSFGHGMTRENYAFLLERVLEEPWLAVLMKPKVPSTLRQRLGPVAELLERAEATGRCLVYEGGALHGSCPPAAAALAADVMVHGHLCAATAGVEAALAGVPTLMLDREGWSVSPLYRLGVGRVVFTEWSALWKACREHWERPGGVLGFGDWSPMLQELDPFRDGRAAERMGTYLQWLLVGFQEGLDRDTVMADAAERYRARWGKETVMPINCDSADAVSVRPPSGAPLAATEEILA